MSHCFLLKTEQKGRVWNKASRWQRKTKSQYCCRCIVFKCNLKWSQMYALFFVNKGRKLHGFFTLLHDKYVILKTYLQLFVCCSAPTTATSIPKSHSPILSVSPIFLTTSFLQDNPCVDTDERTGHLSCATWPVCCSTLQTAVFMTLSPIYKTLCLSLSPSGQSVHILVSLICRWKNKAPGVCYVHYVTAVIPAWMSVY